MNPGRYFVPNMAINPMMVRNGYGLTHGTGLFTKIMRGIRSFNWSGLLSGANKTLNVMNQTIPLIREAKPMVGNVKNMIKLARAFGSETNKGQTINSTNYRLQQSQKSSNNINHPHKSNHNTTNNDYPTFFV